MVCTAAPRRTSRGTTRLARRRIKPLLGTSTIAVIPGFIGHAPDGSVTTLGRGGSDLTATLHGPRARRGARVAVEGRPGNPDRRSAARVRRPAHPAAPSSRGGRSRALRRQGPAPARAHPDRRNAHHAARALVHPPRAAGHRSLGEALARDLSGQGDRDRARPGDRHRRRQGHGRRPRHRGADVRRGRRRTSLGLDHLPGVVGELDWVHACPRARPSGPSRACARRSATNCTRASSTT